MCTLFNYVLFFFSTCVYVCVTALLCARVQCGPRAVRIFFFFFSFGGNFHIARGHVGMVPTPGAVGAR